MATTATRSHSLVATALHSHTYGQLQHHQLMPHTTIFTGNLHRCCPSHLVEFLSILSLISIYVHSPYVHGAQRRTSSLGPAADTHVSRKSHISEKVSPPPRSTLTGHRPHHALFTPLPLQIRRLAPCRQLPALTPFLQCRPRPHPSCFFAWSRV